MKTNAVIVSAGSGVRMGNSLPKQFITVLDKPLLAYTLGAFAAAFETIQFIVVTHPDYFNITEEICAVYPGTIIVAGGASRFASVKAGLAHAEADSIVFIHDAVRCLVTKELIIRCYITALAKGNAVPAIPARDSIRRIDSYGNHWVDRNTIRLVQTPQTFAALVIKNAYASAAGEDFSDDAMVVEQSGVPINLIEGEITNIKVTWPSDLLLAETILQNTKLSG